MSNIRRALMRSLTLGETAHDTVRAVRDQFSADETALLEALKKSAVFKNFPKEQVDRHTLRQMLVQISDKPVSLCETVANKCERLINKGLLNESLESKKALTEAEVPEERPASKDGDGEMKQGPADSTASEHDSKDVGSLAKDSPSGAADQGCSQNKDKHGDKSGIAKDGYMKEKEMGPSDAKDDRDPQLGEGEEAPKDAKDPAPAKDDRSPVDAGKLAEDDEEDEEEQDETATAPPTAPAAPAPAASAAPAAAPMAPKAEKCKEMKEARRSLKVERRAIKERIRALRAEGKESSPEMVDLLKKESTLKCSIKALKESVKALKNSLREAEEVAKDAKDPASDAAHRAANDATLKNGVKQNESEEKPETKDADTPDYSNVQAEDPSKSELNKGPVSPKLESFEAIDARIQDIIREAGIPAGTPSWTEAYVRGWSLAMEHRAKKLSECK